MGPGEGSGWDGGGWGRACGTGSPQPWLGYASTYGEALYKTPTHGPSSQGPEPYQDGACSSILLTRLGFSNLCPTSQQKGLQPEVPELTSP